MRYYLATMLDQASRIPDLVSVAVHESYDLVAGGGSGSGWNQGWGLLRSDLTRRAKWATVNVA